MQEAFNAFDQFMRGEKNAKEAIEAITGYDEAKVIDEMAVRCMAAMAAHSFVKEHGRKAVAPLASMFCLSLGYNDRAESDATAAKVLDYIDGLVAAVDKSIATCQQFKEQHGTD